MTRNSDSEVPVDTPQKMWGKDLNSLVTYQKMKIIFNPYMSRKLLFGSVWAFSGKATAMLLVIFFNAILAHILSVEEMGTYILLVSFISVMAIVGQMGLGNTIVRLVAESLGMGQPRRAVAIIKKAFIIACFSIMIVSIVLFTKGQWMALSLFQSSQMGNVINLIALWVIVASMHGLLVETFRGFHDLRSIALVGDAGKQGVSLILLILFWLIYGYLTLENVILILLVAGLLTIGVGGFLLYRKTMIFENNSYEKVYVPHRKILSIALPILVTNILFFVLRQIDIWILGVFRPRGEVAVYGAVVNLVLLIGFSLSISNAVLPPLIAEMYTQGKIKKLEKILRGMAFLSGIPALLLFLLFVLAGGPILGSIFGDYYKAGWHILVILGFGRLMSVWAGSCQLTLMMTGYQRILMLGTVFTTGLATIFALLLVDEYGMEGVAVATTLALLLQNYTMLLIVKWKTGIWTHVGFVKRSKFEYV